MRGTENTHPLKKYEIQELEGSSTYHVPAKVVVKSVVRSSNALIIHGRFLIVTLLSRFAYRCTNAVLTISCLLNSAHVSPQVYRLVELGIGLGNTKHFLRSRDAVEHLSDSIFPQ